jgi:hypothetical protein
MSEQQRRTRRDRKKDREFENNLLIERCKEVASNRAKYNVIDKNSAIDDDDYANDTNQSASEWASTPSSSSTQSSWTAQDGSEQGTREEIVNQAASMTDADVVVFDGAMIASAHSSANDAIARGIAEAVRHDKSDSLEARQRRVQMGKVEPLAMKKKRRRRRRDVARIQSAEDRKQQIDVKFLKKEMRRRKKKARAATY